MFPLTIGMAVHEDYHGAFFTVNALRLYQDIRDCELVVVDNSPHTPAGAHTRQMVQNCGHGFASAKYIAAPEVVGTSAPRNRVFAEASGEAVLCMDCHVLLVPGAIARLKQYYRDHLATGDLLSGPLLFDNVTEVATHFSPRWRAEMEGTWSLAWRCQCGAYIDVVDEPEQTTTVYRALLSEGPFKAEYRCNCGAIAPACPWQGHERILLENGWQPAGMQPDDPPFEIPAQGLGLFSCRKEAWLGFHPAFAGFGGEECYIHRKYRQAGHQAINLPWLGWYHRFGRPEPLTYNLERYSKARNYVIGYQETGLDLEAVKKEFVKSGGLAESEWVHLLADPIRNAKSPAASACSSCGSGQALAPTEAELPAADRQRFVELVAQHKRVAILAKRDWWKTVAGEGQPESLQFFPANGSIPAIDECDLLIIHSIHHADQLLRELSAMAPKVSSRILLRSTAAFGEQAEGGGPGLLPALRLFMRKNPEWHVIEHSMDNWGFTVISRDPADKKPLPSMFTMAANLAKAVAAHVADGLEKSTVEQLEARLNLCSLCDQRRDDRCAACGCFVAAKAAMRSSECPLGKWPSETNAA